MCQFCCQEEILCVAYLFYRSLTFPRALCFPVPTTLHGHTSVCACTCVCGCRRTCLSGCIQYLCVWMCVRMWVRAASMRVTVVCACEHVCVYPFQRCSGGCSISFRFCFTLRPELIRTRHARDLHVGTPDFPVGRPAFYRFTFIYLF